MIWSGWSFNAQLLNLIVQYKFHCGNVLAKVLVVEMSSSKPTMQQLRILNCQK